MGLGVAIAICSLVATGAGFTLAMVRFGMAIENMKRSIADAARGAKHDAINAVSDKIALLDERKLSADVYQSDRESLQHRLEDKSRRLEALERKTGLDGSGPHHT